MYVLYSFGFLEKRVVLGPSLAQPIRANTCKVRSGTSGSGWLLRWPGRHRQRAGRSVCIHPHGPQQQEGAEEAGRFFRSTVFTSTVLGRLAKAGPVVWF